MESKSSSTEGLPIAKNRDEVAFHSSFIIITGGPGTGKTSLIEDLRERKYNCVNEVARQIIKEQICKGGDALPWKNTGRYVDLMLARSIISYIENEQASSTTFFDRGIPDTFAYMRMINYQKMEALSFYIHKYPYNKHVFLLPYWEEIYQTDNERKQNNEEAKRTYTFLKETYTRYGYVPVEVPLLPIKDKVEFILSYIQSFRQITTLHEKRGFYPFLLDADPSEEMIEKYLDKSEVFVMEEAGHVVGVVAVLPINDHTYEIKNIAILPDRQGQGYGRKLIHFVFEKYRSQASNIIVGTTKTGVLFYEKCGFHVSHIKKNFFVDNYPDPIYEDGVRCIDMIYLSHTYK